MSRRTTGLLVACGGAYLAFLDTTIVNTSFPDIAASFPEADRSQLSLDPRRVLHRDRGAAGAGRRAGRPARAQAACSSAASSPSSLTSLAVRARADVGAAGRRPRPAGMAAAVMAPVSLALCCRCSRIERRATGVGIWGAAAALAAAERTADRRRAGRGRRLALDLPRQPAARRCSSIAAGRGRSTRAATSTRPACPTSPARRWSALGARRARARDRRGHRVGLGLADGDRPLRRRRRPARRRRLPLHAPPAARGRPAADADRVVPPRERSARCCSRWRSSRRSSATSCSSPSVWGYSVLDAGLATVPGPLMSAIIAGPAGRLADRFGHRAVIVPGTICYAAGLLVLRSAGLEPDYVGTWLPGMLLAGTGIGLAFPNLGSRRRGRGRARPLRQRQRGLAARSARSAPCSARRSSSRSSASPRRSPPPTTSPTRRTCSGSSPRCSRAVALALPRPARRARARPGGGPDLDAVQRERFARV